MIFLRAISYLFGLGIFTGFAVTFLVAVYLSNILSSLPDYRTLKEYEPPIMTRVHASNGSLIAEYARERRLFIPIQAIPNLIKQAFISAEDKNFITHPGVDLTGVVRAMVINFKNFGKGRKLVGASTITQQVAKNFLLSSEQSFDRKIKEALLAFRIERALSKDEIFELYLNEIFFGLQASGIGAASLVYFGKSIHELTLAEAAYMAALPKAPNNYHPFRYPKRAVARRNWVIDRMVVNGYVKAQEAELAKRTELKVSPRQRGAFLEGSEYFAEAVRRQLEQQYGEDDLYGGGLSVRATLDPQMQIWARDALQDGLIKFDQKKGWRGPVAKMLESEDWGLALSKIPALSDANNWKLAVVLSLSLDHAIVGLKPERKVGGKFDATRQEGIITVDAMKWAVPVDGLEGNRKVEFPSDILEVGDVVYVEPLEVDDSGAAYFGLRQVPKVSGALVAMDPRTGRVLALVGGFSYYQSEFNRAIQAKRQPGSSFKPFVYAAALENGYSPASVVLDAPIEIDQGNEDGIWSPQNYSGKYFGPSTLRLGIEQSRNAMTVRLARDMGMPLIEEYAKRFGVYPHMPHLLSMALGAGETTLLRMTTAYSILANGGRRVRPTMIDRVQDRWGKSVYKHDERLCETCLTDEWNGQSEPILVDTSERVLSEQTTYQITSMLEGVVQRGTATRLRKLGLPIAGKTGTTNEERDAWFVGFSSNLVVGVYIGFDIPEPMGKGATGGGLAAPVFLQFMKSALQGNTPVPFKVPRGVELVRVDYRTGQRSVSGGKEVILEAFKHGANIPDGSGIIGLADNMGTELTVSEEADRSVSEGIGGLY